MHGLLLLCTDTPKYFRIRIPVHFPRRRIFQIGFVLSNQFKFFIRDERIKPHEADPKMGSESLKLRIIPAFEKRLYESAPNLTFLKWQISKSADRTCLVLQERAVTVHYFGPEFGIHIPRVAIMRPMTSARNRRESSFLVMSAPPFPPRLVELLHENFARRLSEVPIRSAQTRRSSAETQEFLVAHLSKTSPHFVELEWLKSYGAHISRMVRCTPAVPSTFHSPSPRRRSS